MNMFDYTRHLLRSVDPDRVERFISDNFVWLRHADPVSEYDKMILYAKIKKLMKIKIVIPSRREGQ